MEQSIVPNNNVQSTDDSLKIQTEPQQERGVHKFIAEFSHRLQVLTNQMQSVDSNQSVDVYKIALESQITSFLSLKDDVAWMGILLDSNKLELSPMVNSGSVLAKLKDCYKTFSTLSMDCIQEHVNCLRGNIYLVEQQIQMLNSRPQLNFESDVDPVDVNIHLLNQSAGIPEPSAPPMDSMNSYIPEPSAPPFESMFTDDRIEQTDYYSVRQSSSSDDSNFLECINRNLDEDVLANQEGTVYLSDIKDRLAETVINSAAGMFYVDCPVTFESFYSGDSMYVLYDSQEYSNVSELLTNPSLKFHLYSHTAAKWAVENMSDPLTRNKVDSLCKVTINEKKITQFVSQSGLHQRELGESIRHVKECSKKLSELFSDMADNVEHYQQQLGFVSDKLEKYHGGHLNIASSKEVLTQLQDVNRLQLALCQYNDDSNSAKGIPIETNVLVSQLETFSNSTTELIDQFNSIIESGYVLKLKQMCEGISSAIARVNADSDVHSELLVELKSSNLVTLKLLSQIERKLNKYKYLMVQLRLFSESSSFQDKLISDCEFEINKLENLINEIK
jgi:hypothetical protein